MHDQPTGSRMLSVRHVRVSFMHPRGLSAACAALLVIASVTVSLGQRGVPFRGSRDHPAIAYSTGPAHNGITELNQQLREGVVTLEATGSSGYLRSVLTALDISLTSQVAVFSPTSFQARLINSKNPRVIYFNDSVSVAWVRGGDMLEVAAQDRQQGVLFYTLDQNDVNTPQFQRNDSCLACHLSWDTLAVPGLQVLSTAPLSSDPLAYASGYVSDHRSPLEHRWGGWYVTGQVGPVSHMGNVEVTNVDEPTSLASSDAPQLDSLADRFDVTGYLSPHSDVVALMVLEHQTHMTNLITRLGWETRRIGFREAANPSVFDQLMAEAAVELVDYLLFVDESLLETPVVGSSGFTRQFADRSPRDRQGRSLRDFDLETRLFRYPCSYMIYTDAFEALPAMAKTAIYKRMWEVLSGRETAEAYEHLTQAARQAVVDILVDTLPGLPDYFQAAIVR